MNIYYFLKLKPALLSVINFIITAIFFFFIITAKEYNTSLIMGLYIVSLQLYNFLWMNITALYLTKEYYEKPKFSITVFLLTTLLLVSSLIRLIPESNELIITAKSYTIIPFILFGYYLIYIMAVKIKKHSVSDQNEFVLSIFIAITMAANFIGVWFLQPLLNKLVKKS